MVSIDQNWELLKEKWLNTGKRKATSVSFVIDQQGVIRFVHPGPRIFWTHDPKDAAANSEMIRLENFIKDITKK